MEIDTLIFSGGGPSGIAYTGVFQALLDEHIIDRNLQDIKHIITTSIGILFSFCILLKLDNRVGYTIVKKFNIKSFLNVEGMCIDDLLVDCGLFATTGIHDVFQSLCRNVLKREDISLVDLYQLTGIKLSVKVFNITDSVLEFISHETHPELSLITLAQMTTAIPLFFKPVSYKGYLYCDGGFRHGYPYGYTPSPHYLGVKIKGGCGTDWCSDIPLLQTVYSLITGSDEHKGEDSRVIEIEPKLGLNFDIDDATKQRVVDAAYYETIQHIHTHFI
jgi:hypothetical protein